MARIQSVEKIRIQSAVTAAGHGIRRTRIEHGSFIVIVAIRSKYISLCDGLLYKILAASVVVKAERPNKVVGGGRLPTFRFVNGDGSAYFNEAPREYSRVFL